MDEETRDVSERIAARRKVVKKRKRRKLLVIIILLLLCLVAALYLVKMLGSSNAPDDPEKTANEIVTEEEQAAKAEEEKAKAEAAAAEKIASHVYSHRGSAGDDELTLAAYDKAIEGGSRYIEADIVVSASGTPYLAHDDFAKDMTGYSGYFSGMTDSQIDSLTTKSGSKMLKLSVLFDEYGDSVTYLVDIKYASPRNREAFEKVVKEYGYEDRVIATSMYFDVLRPLDETFPDMKKLYISTDQATFDLSLTKSYVDIVSVPKDIMTEENREAAHSSGKRFSAWTLNTEDEISKAIDLGVDSYFTDDSALAIKLEKANRAE